MSTTPSTVDVTAEARRHLGADVTCTSVERTTVGNSQETYFVSIDGVDGAREFVLRRTADGGTIDWSDRALEVEVLAAASAARLPVPRVWWWEPDGSILQRAYTVMDRSPGTNPDLRDESVCATLADDLGRHIARLHREAVAPTGLDHPGDSVSASRAQLAWWTERARTSPMCSRAMAALLGWLHATMPDDGVAPVLVWGDPGPHNVLTDEHGTVTALLDWELAHVGHPLFDLGAARWACLGQLDRELLTAAYERESSTSVDRSVLTWFEVLACLSRSIMLYDGMSAATDGRAGDPNVLALGLVLVNSNLTRAARLAWGELPGEGREETSVALPDRPSIGSIQRSIARFLDTDLRNAVDDARVRRSAKIAAALLDTLASADDRADDRADETSVEDHWTWFDAEASGTESESDRRTIIARLARERAAFGPLVALYGQTVAVD